MWKTSFPRGLYEFTFCILQILFKILNPGGLYVIEDIHTSYWRSYGGYGSVGAPRGGYLTTVGFLKDLIDDSINFIPAYTERACSMITS